MDLKVETRETRQTEARQTEARQTEAHQTGGAPVLGRSAPNFRARSTRGTVTLSDYRGGWVVLFSHPADFTPVCTSEFLAFAKAQPRFEALGCALLGLSVDSLPAHLAWVDAIHRDLGVEIRFPIIEDPSMTIARAYGMLDETAQNSSTVRSTFIIAPDGTIRAILTYPLSVGRCVAEIERTVRALQHTADGTRLTPENWHPGDPVFLPPPTETCRLHACGDTEGLEDQPWYHRLQADDAA